MCLTFADILMRFYGRPIIGIYEVVAYMGVCVTGFALPRASLMKAQVYVDLFIEKLPRIGKRILRIITRILVCVMFLIASWYFIKMGMQLIATRAVTLSLRVPFYPVVFGLAVSSIAQCLVSVCEIVEEARGNR